MIFYMWFFSQEIDLPTYDEATGQVFDLDNIEYLFSQLDTSSI